MAVITNADIEASIPSIGTISSGSLEERLVDGINGIIENRICQRTFSKTAHVRERYTVRPPRMRDGVPIEEQNQIRLKHYPVIESYPDDPFILELEASIDSQGQTDSVSTIDRTSYLVEYDCGIVTLRTSITSVDILFSSGSFPSAQGVILATYKAGFASVPDELKIGATLLFQRLWKVFKNEQSHVSSIQSDFGTTELIRRQLTPEELLFFSGFKRVIFG